MRHLHVLQFVHLHVLHTQPLNWEFQPIILFVLFRSSQIIDICILKTKHDPQLCTHIVEGQTEAEVLAPESVQLKSIINLCGLTCSSLILAKPYFTENHASTCCQGCFISHLVREGVKEKKTFSFGHCPNYLNPPPMIPIRATWSSFFGSRNSRFQSQFRTKNTICTM